MRKFSRPGDAEAAFDLVLRSDGLQRAGQLAEKYKDEALSSVEYFQNSSSKQKLIDLIEFNVNRKK